MPPKAINGGERDQAAKPTGHMSRINAHDAAEGTVAPAEWHIHEKLRQLRESGHKHEKNRKFRACPPTDRSVFSDSAIAAGIIIRTFRLLTDSPAKAG